MKGIKHYIALTVLLAFSIASSGQINPETDLIISKSLYAEMKAKLASFPVQLKAEKVKQDSLRADFDRYKIQNGSLLSEMNEELEELLEENEALAKRNATLEAQHLKDIASIAEKNKFIKNVKETNQFLRIQLNKCKGKKSRKNISVNGKNSALDLIQD